MADSRGVWGLSESWAEKNSDQWVPIPNVWVDLSESQVTTAGYYIGGSTNSPYVAMSNIDKLTYSNDTISTPPTASGFGRYTAPAPYNYYDNLTVSNNGAFALFTGWHINNTPSPAPVMYKHDFSTDDVTTVPSLAPVFPSAGGNGGAGTDETTWWHASTGSAGSYDAIKITYATESYAALPSGTGFSSNGLGSSTRIFQNQLVAGYTPASAPSNPGASQCKKLTFATDTFTDNGWTLNSNRNGMAAVDAGSDDNTGLVAGGSSSPSPSNAVEKITLNSSTVSSAPSLSGGRYSGAAHSSGSDGSGYFSAMSSGGGPTADISKVPFSSYSFSSIPSGATLSSIRRNCKGYSGLSKALKAGMSAPIERWFDSGTEPPNTGYSYEGSQGDTAYKTDLSSDTAATNPGAQQLTDVYRQGSVSSSTAGYASGGQTGPAPSTTVSITQKTTYSSDTLVRLPGSNLPERINFNSGISDGTAGWYWGGHYQYPTSYNWTNIYKITYATEAMSTPGVQMTSGGNTKMSSTNSETAGYSAGGDANYTNVDKLVFSTETTSELPAVLPLHGNMYGTASVGTQTAGYWAGGASRTDVSKMTWATETAALIPSGFLSPGKGRNYMFSLGNTTDGYFCGGSPSPARTVDKLNYSTDTSAESPSLGPSPMRNSQQNVGMGARAKGIPVNIAPTATPTASTSGVPVNFALRIMHNGSATNIGKLDFTTDSTSKLTDQPGPFTASNQSGGWNDNSNGRMVYGTAGAGPDIFGLPYTTGTVTKISDTPISGVAAAIYKVWTYSTTHGFFSGGRSWSPSYPSHHTTTSRYTFSTDTVEASYPSQRLVNAVERARGVANSTHGFVMGGRTSNSGTNDRSYVQKASFSTGDFSVIPSGNLDDTTTGHNVTGNTTSARIAGKDTQSGETDESRFQKFTYSNDTMTILPGSTLPGTPSNDNGKGVAATGNQTQGYFGGSDSINPETNVKIVYATDTTSETPAWVGNAGTGYTVAKSAGEQNGSGKAPSPNVI